MNAPAAPWDQPKEITMSLPFSPRRSLRTCLVSMLALSGSWLAAAPALAEQTDPLAGCEFSAGIDPETGEPFDNWSQWVERRTPGELIMSCLVDSHDPMDAWNDVHTELNRMDGSPTGREQIAEDVEKVRPRPGTIVNRYRVMYWTERATNEFTNGPVDFGESIPWLNTAGVLTPEPIIASGDIYVPVTGDGSELSPTEGSPVVLYNHGIGYKLPFYPENCDMAPIPENQDAIDECNAKNIADGKALGMDENLAIVLAGRGNVVAAPHYVGFDAHIRTWFGGIGRTGHFFEDVFANAHAYMHSHSTGRAALDMLTVTRRMCDELATDAWCDPTDTNFVAGVSQGGQVVMSALSQMSAENIEVTAATVASGAFDTLAIASHHVGAFCEGPHDTLTTLSIMMSVISLDRIYGLGPLENVCDNTRALSSAECPENDSCSMAQYASVLRFPQDERDFFGALGPVTLPGWEDSKTQVACSPQTTADVGLAKVFNIKFLEDLRGELASPSTTDCAKILSTDPAAAVDPEAQDYDGDPSDPAVRVACSIRANTASPEDAPDSTFLYASACQSDPTIPYSVAFGNYESSIDVVRDISEEPELAYDWGRASIHKDFRHIACVAGGGLLAPNDIFSQDPQFPIEFSAVRKRRKLTLSGWTVNQLGSTSLPIDVYKDGELTSHSTSDASLLITGKRRDLKGDYHVCVAASYDAYPYSSVGNQYAEAVRCSEVITVN